MRCAMTIDELFDYFYNEFKGLPNENPIVRMNKKDDAFTLVVLEILYSDNYDFEIRKNNISQISNIIVAPPDNGIDIVIEKDDGDEYIYEFIQVKNSSLAERDIKNCFIQMERTIEDYLNGVEGISKNLLNILKETQLDSYEKDNIKFLTVYNGAKKNIQGLKDNELVICRDDLINILESKETTKYKTDPPKVPREVLKSDAFNNFMMYGDDACLVNICGLDLAELAQKYDKTEIGRSILFGQNLRDSLITNKSNTYRVMKDTIDNEPEKFWYYNNGITILADEVNLKDEDNTDITYSDKPKQKVDKIILSRFSIINGAQTTSALGKYLKDALDEKKAKEKLNKVFVFARILKISNNETKRRIAIYNNTQNPITTRDMISNNEEQIMLYYRLLKDQKPPIYMEIRRGQGIGKDFPEHIYAHRKTNNEILAQLAFAGFKLEPYIAKDKKKTLFDKKYDDKDVIINEYYDQIFNYDKNDESRNGILFKKNNNEIDELLFVKYLYREGNKYIKNNNLKTKSKIEEEMKNIDDDNIKEFKQQAINTLKNSSSISNIALFYVVTYYYCLKNLGYGGNFEIDCEEFYKDKKYQETIIEHFAQIFMMPTIEAIRNLSEGSASPAAWVRAKNSQKIFKEYVMKTSTSDLNLKSNVNVFFEKLSKQTETV